MLNKLAIVAHAFYLSTGEGQNQAGLCFPGHLVLKKASKKLKKILKILFFMTVTTEILFVYKNIFYLFGDNYYVWTTYFGHVHP